MVNNYETLNVRENATPEEIKRAYRLKAKEHHPDKNPGCRESEERMKRVIQAYETLSNPEKRMAHDADLDRVREAMKNSKRTENTWERPSYTQSTGGQYRPTFSWGAMAFFTLLLLVISLAVSEKGNTPKIN